MATMQDVTKLLRDLRPKTYALPCENATSYALVSYVGTLAEQYRMMGRVPTLEDETTFIFRMRHGRFGSAKTRVHMTPELLIGYGCKDWWKLCRKIADEDFRQFIAERREEERKAIANLGKDT